MGFSTDDKRIPDSFSIARERGIEFSFTPNEIETEVHPNTVDIAMTGSSGRRMTVRGESLGRRKNPNYPHQSGGGGFFPASTTR